MERRTEVRVMSSVLGKTMLTASAFGCLAVLAAVLPASASGPAAPAAAAVDCPNADLAPRPRSYFSSDVTGLGLYVQNRYRVKDAVRCLINAQRAAHGVAPVVQYVGLRGSRTVVLTSVAQGHADAAARLQWWGKVEPGKNCVPRKDKPSECDSHINPQTGLDPGGRVKAAGFCAAPRTLLRLRENTYTGAGANAGVQYSTPRAAVTWWMGSQLHRETLLDPALKEVGIGMAPASADPAGAAYSPAGTYVTDYATCVS